MTDAENSSEEHPFHGLEHVKIVSAVDPISFCHCHSFSDSGPATHQIIAQRSNVQRQGGSSKHAKGVSSTP
jgi:hypothetical protein